MADTRIHMSFAQTFRELRMRRRLPMTMWEPEISSPYVNEVEKKGLLPGEEKLDALTRVFVAVAREQGAADPEADARLLRWEHERSYLTQRAKLDPRLVDLYMITRRLIGSEEVEREQSELLDTLKQTVEALSGLPADQRDELLGQLHEAVEPYKRAALSPGEEEVDRHDKVPTASP